MPDAQSNQPSDVALLIFAGFEKSNFARDPEAEKAKQAQPPTTLPWLIQNPDATPEQVNVDFGSRKKNLNKARPDVLVAVLVLAILVYRITLPEQLK